jgi:hypothetical protein
MTSVENRPLHSSGSSQYSGIYFQELRRTRENVSQDGICPCRDSKRHSSSNNLKCLKAKRSGKCLTSRSITDENIMKALHKAYNKLIQTKLDKRDRRNIKRFWRWCVTHRITGFWTFSIFRYSREQKTRRLGNCVCFRPEVKAEEIPTQLGPLERAKVIEISSF